jgi:hypothetical protein
MDMLSDDVPMCDNSDNTHILHGEEVAHNKGNPHCSLCDTIDDSIVHDTDGHMTIDSDSKERHLHVFLCTVWPLLDHMPHTPTVNHP